jgi:hypothetical protein
MVCIFEVHVERIEGTPWKEGTSGEETQDMAGGWRPRRDQAEGCSYGSGRPRVCA